MKDYQVQGLDFLRRYGLRFEAANPSGVCPSWDDDGKHIHGLRYTVTLSGQTPHGLRRISFPFWNSFKDSKEGKAPTPYDVLACLSGDISCPETFAEYCANYGENEDSRRAERQFLTVRRFALKLQDFFTPGEISALQEIQ